MIAISSGIKSETRMAGATTYSRFGIEVSGGRGGETNSGRLVDHGR